MVSPSDSLDRFQRLMGSRLDQLRQSADSRATLSEPIGPEHVPSQFTTSQEHPTSITAQADALDDTEVKAKFDDEDKTTVHGNLTSVEQYLQEPTDSQLRSPSAWAASTTKISKSKPLASGRPNLHQPVHEVEPPKGGIINDATYKADRHMGEVAPQGLSFAPFAAVTKYCYKFAPSDYIQPLASAFWDGGKIWDRHWDLFYVRPSFCAFDKPLILVPEPQLVALLNECNSAFPASNLTITDQNRDDGLVLEFDFPQPDLRPRYLGISDSRARHDFLVEEIPDAEEVEPPDMSTIAGPHDDRSLDRFKQMLALAQEVSKNKKTKRSKAKADEQKVHATNSLLETQRFLGLALSQEGLHEKDKGLSTDLSKLKISSTLDTSKAAPYSPAEDAVLIAIDLEAWEHANNAITEVGIATLDTRDLAGLSPGHAGEDWRQVIRARHFRISEHKHKVNRDFVQGCPDKFEFGESEIISLDHVASLCTSCFHPPFSARLEDGSLAPIPGDRSAPPRKIILIGHDLSSDIEMCKKIGFNPIYRGNLHTTLDTATLYRAYKRDPNPKALGVILSDFDIAGWNLHNAGNDAVYTLWVLLAMAVSAAAERGTEQMEKRFQADVERRTEEAIARAKARVNQEVLGWDRDGEGDEKVGSGDNKFASEGEIGAKPVFGPPVPPKGISPNGLYTMGGAPLDV